MLFCLIFKVVSFLAIDVYFVLEMAIVSQRWWWGYLLESIGPVGHIYNENHHWWTVVFMDL